MDRDTIRRMDPELYQEKLEEAVMDDVSCILNVNKGHSSTLHTDISIDDMITRKRNRLFPVFTMRKH